MAYTSRARYGSKPLYPAPTAFCTSKWQRPTVASPPGLWAPSLPATQPGYPTVAPETLFSLDVCCYCRHSNWPDHRVKEHRAVATPAVPQQGWPFAAGAACLLSCYHVAACSAALLASPLCIDRSRALTGKLSRQNRYSSSCCRRTSRLSLLAHCSAGHCPAGSLSTCASWETS